MLFCSIFALGVSAGVLFYSIISFTNPDVRKKPALIPRNVQPTTSAPDILDVRIVNSCDLPLDEMDDEHYRIHLENKLIVRMKTNVRNKRSTEWLEPFDANWMELIRRDPFLNRHIDASKITDRVKEWWRLKHDPKNNDTPWKWTCPVCDHYSQMSKFKKVVGIEPVMFDERFENSLRITKHQESETHKRAMALLERDRNSLESQHVFNAAGVTNSMINMLKVVYVEAKTNVAADNHRTMIALLQQTGSAIGERYFGRKAFNEMLEFISLQTPVSYHSCIA